MNLAKSAKTAYVLSRISAYCLMHPLWSYSAYKMYSEYKSKGGDFLDTDYYEITMGEPIWRYFQHIGAVYKLTLRREVEFPEGFDRALQAWVNTYAANNHSISYKQYEYLKKHAPYLGEEYPAYLLDKSQPKILAEHVKITQIGGKLDVLIDGPIHQSSRWEEPLMAAISEIYYKMAGTPIKNWDWLVIGWDKCVATKKAKAIVSEFGMRRRRSFDVQLGFLLAAKASGAVMGPQDTAGIIGTSNVYLAMMMKMKMIGTMGHKFTMALASIYGHEFANRLMVALWSKAFLNDLGYFLTDTLGSDNFFNEVSKYPHDAISAIARYSTGFRQDSGDAKEYTLKVINFYKKMGLTKAQIKQKVIIYSDGLNLDEVKKLKAFAQEQGIGCAFGIGTNFTNDGFEDKPMNMVIKLYEIYELENPSVRNGSVKVSDTPTKVTGEEKAKEQVLHWLKTGEVQWEPLRDHTMDFPEFQI